MLCSKTAFRNVFWRLFLLFAFPQKYHIQWHTSFRRSGMTGESWKCDKLNQLSFSFVPLLKTGGSSSRTIPHENVAFATFCFPFSILAFHFTIQMEKVCSLMQHCVTLNLINKRKKNNALNLRWRSILLEILWRFWSDEDKVGILFLVQFCLLTKRGQ